MQERSVRSTPTATCNSEHETKLHCLKHLTSLFESLSSEISSPSYEIGSQTRFRIEKHISSARAIEIGLLSKVHSEAVVRDVWQRLESPLEAMPDSLSESYTPRTLDADIVGLASLKKREPRGQNFRVDWPSDEAIGRNSVPASGEESKSWLTASYSADEEHDLMALRSSLSRQRLSPIAKIPKSHSSKPSPLPEAHFTAQMQSEGSQAHRVSNHRAQYDQLFKQNGENPINEVCSLPDPFYPNPVAALDARETEHLESKDFNTGDTKLDELLRLWTPAAGPAQGSKVQKIKKGPSCLTSLFLWGEKGKKEKK